MNNGAAEPGRAILFCTESELSYHLRALKSFLRISA